MCSVLSWAVKTSLVVGSAGKAEQPASSCVSVGGLHTSNASATATGALATVL